jgi:hypothetical protein
LNPNLEEALAFFGLSREFTDEELKKTYHNLALKYHPDRGEYTSDVLFVQLLQYKSILEQYSLEDKDTAPHESPDTKTQSDFQIYKKAKKIENDAILQYFQSTKHNLRMELSIERNPKLAILLTQLEKAKLLYEQLLKDYPQSIWARDTKDSLESMKVWWNYA